MAHCDKWYIVDIEHRFRDISILESYSLYRSMRQYCHTHIGEQAEWWNTEKYIWYFQYEADAIAFKLTFG